MLDDIFMVAAAIIDQKRNNCGTNAGLVNHLPISVGDIVVTYEGPTQSSCTRSPLRDCHGPEIYVSVPSRRKQTEAHCHLNLELALHVGCHLRIAEKVSHQQASINVISTWRNVCPESNPCLGG